MSSLPRASSSVLSEAAYEDLMNEEGKNAILRPTLLANSINKRYDGIILTVINNDTKFIESRDNHRKYIINEPNKFISRFSYICDIETPDGIFYMFPVLSDGDMQNIERELSSTVKGVKFDSLIVERAIIGDACYRKFDNLYSDQYLSLVKRKSIQPQKRTLYK